MITFRLTSFPENLWSLEVLKFSRGTRWINSAMPGPSFWQLPPPGTAEAPSWASLWIPRDHPYLANPPTHWLQPGLSPPRASPSLQRPTAAPLLWRRGMGPTLTRVLLPALPGHTQHPGVASKAHRDTKSSSTWEQSPSGHRTCTLLRDNTVFSHYCIIGRVQTHASLKLHQNPTAVLSGQTKLNFSHQWWVCDGIRLGKPGITSTEPPSHYQNEHLENWTPATEEESENSEEHLSSGCEVLLYQSSVTTTRLVTALKTAPVTGTSRPKTLTSLFDVNPLWFHRSNPGAKSQPWITPGTTRSSLSVGVQHAAVCPSCNQRCSQRSRDSHVTTTSTASRRPLPPWP